MLTMTTPTRKMPKTRKMTIKTTNATRKAMDEDDEDDDNINDDDDDEEDYD